MTDQPEYTLPNGQVAKWNEQSQTYQVSDAKTPEEVAGAKALMETAVKWGKRLITWGAWMLAGFMLKIFLSVADQFDNYSARPVAAAVGEALGMLFKVMLGGAVCLLLLALFIEFFKGHTGPQKKAVKHEDTKTDKRLSAQKTEAQKLLS